MARRKFETVVAEKPENRHTEIKTFQDWADRALKYMRMVRAASQTNKFPVIWPESPSFHAAELWSEWKFYFSQKGITPHIFKQVETGQQRSFTVPCALPQTIDEQYADKYPITEKLLNLKVEYADDAPAAQVIYEHESPEHRAKMFGRWDSLVGRVGALGFKEALKTGYFATDPMTRGSFQDWEK